MDEAVAYFVGRWNGDAKREIIEAARHRGLSVVAFFVDSGRVRSIPVWKRRNYRAMIDFALAHRIKTIIIYSLSGFSRNLREAEAELQRLESEGFTYYFIKP